MNFSFVVQSQSSKYNIFKSGRIDSHEKQDLKSDRNIDYDWKGWQDFFGNNLCVSSTDSHSWSS